MTGAELSGFLWESASEVSGASGAPGWADALTQGVVTVAATLVIAAIVGGFKKLTRIHHSFHDRLEELEEKLEDVNTAVNKTTGDTLTKRIDKILTAVTVADVNHHNLARRVDHVETHLGEYPPITMDQARDIARQRADHTGPDNPEDHL